MFQALPFHCPADRRTLSHLFAVCLLFQFTACAAQQHKSHSTIGHEVKSLSSSILLIFQAANGDYWFGSDTDGLFRYNGKTILHYTEEDGLSHSRIRSIQEDKQGNVYFATLGGISKFDGSTFRTLEPVKSHFMGKAWQLQPDDLWFSMAGKPGNKGPYRYDGKNLYELEFPTHFLAEEYVKTEGTHTWSPYEVYSIYKDRMGRLWFGTASFGVCRYDGTSFSWLYEDQLTNVPNGGSFGIRSVTEDRDGKFWICNSQQRFTIFSDSLVHGDTVLVHYEKEPGITDMHRTDGRNHIYFMSAVQDTDGNVWLATYDQGIWRYDGKTARQFKIKNAPSNITLYSVYKDRNNQLWLGSHNAGVFKFNGEEFEPFAVSSAQGKY